MVRVPGMYKSFDDLEEQLSLGELELLITKARDVEHERQKFAASLKGINLDGPEENSEEAFEKVKMRAQAKLAGQSEEEFELGFIGINFNKGE
jgi:hypothetical protein